MPLVSESCPSCGASISVVPGLTRMKCPFCATSLTIARDGNDVALEIVDKVTATIEKTGIQTDEAIRDGTYVTQTELRRLQITQELSMVQLQISNVRSEIRSLERMPESRIVRQQLNELRKQELDLREQADQLSAILNPSSSASPEPTDPVTPSHPSNLIVWGVGAAIFIVVALSCLFSLLASDSNNTRVTLTPTQTSNLRAGDSGTGATQEPVATSSLGIVGSEAQASPQPVSTSSLAATSAGMLSLFEGNNATQDLVCNLQAIPTSLNFKSSNDCENDEARSVVLTNLTVGSIIQLFDNPNCEINDDWTEILLKSVAANYVIGTFEQSFEDELVRSTYYPYNGLDGKVSCIKIDIP